MRVTKNKVIGVLGSMLTLTAIMAAPVKAETKETTSANDNISLLDHSAWEDKAAANVKTSANIRSEASVESEKKGILPRGNVVQIIDRQDGWSKVQSGSVEGYIRDDLLVFGEEARNLYQEVHGITATVQASVLRVRQQPSLDSPQIATMPQGSSVEVTGKEGDWYQVSCRQETAYMAAEYMKIDDLEETALSVEEYQELLEQQQQNVQETSVQPGNGELDLLAAIIECEAGGESHTGKVAVGAVIMNRVSSSQFPDSITEVVYQRGQFSPVASGKLSSVLARGARQDCYQAARDALNGSNPIGGALYFNSGYGKGQQIGNQHFY